ncbi:MAG TPA: hypothetical protein DHV85_25605 [Candidatus Accumulibacter sp.]|nr:hypothetical protein [Accumulibacter sp.]
MTAGACWHHFTPATAESLAARALVISRHPGPVALRFASRHWPKSFGWRIPGASWHPIVGYEWNICFV